MCGRSFTRGECPRARGKSTGLKRHLVYDFGITMHRRSAPRVGHGRPGLCKGERRSSECGRHGEAERHQPPCRRLRSLSGAERGPRSGELQNMGGRRGPCLIGSAAVSPRNACCPSFPRLPFFFRFRIGRIIWTEVDLICRANVLHGSALNHW